MEINDLIGILVEQNKSFIEQNKNYKDMLQFAVGGILTVLVIFLTANYFTMRKFRSDEIEKIQMQVLKNIKETSIAEIELELKNNLKTLVENELTSIKFKLDGFELKYKTQNDKSIYLEGLIDKLEGDLYYQKGVFVNAFNCYLDAGNKFISTNNTGYISGIMNLLDVTAEKLPYAISGVHFNRFVSKLGLEYQDQAKKISDILKSKPSI